MDKQFHALLWSWSRISLAWKRRLTGAVIIMVALYSSSDNSTALCHISCCMMLVKATVAWWLLPPMDALHGHSMLTCLCGTAML